MKNFSTMKLNFTTTGVKIAFSLFVLSGSFSAVNAQNVGISAEVNFTPNASAMLDISSTTKGLLIPNVALTATNSAGPISSPATSLMVYNTATAGTAPYNVTPGFYYYNGSAWVAASGPGTSISGTTNYVSKFTGTNTIGNSQIIDNGTNVVIGTITTPSAKLNVEASGTGNLLMLAETTSTPGVPTPRLTADINGNLTISGKFNSNGIEETSDIRFKKDITPLAPVLGKVLQIEGVTYNWRREDFPERAFGERTEIGFIAQELEKVFPELVNTDKEGYKSVQYSHMVPVLLEAIKEQQALMAGMQQQIGTLSAAMEKANAAFEARLQQELQTITQQLQNSSNTRSITDADHR
jgi:hypothetical protein